MKLAYNTRRTQRSGSTLVIVIALLGLLAFMGMVFFTFASQERAASEYFSDAAKSQILDDADVFDWGLRQVIVGPSATERNSILYSPTQRHSMVKNTFGSDIHPYTGAGVSVSSVDPPGGVGVPFVPGAGPDVQNLLDMVDSPMAWGPQFDQQVANNELGRLFQLRGFGKGLPEPDVDYTSPDINTMFVAYRGWAIRDNAEDVNGNGAFDAGEVDRNGNMIPDIPSPRYEAVPVMIPSFFRPQYLKTAGSTRNGNFVPTDPSWVTIDPNNTTFKARSFRPHPAHKTRNFETSAVLPRYVDATEASTLGLISGGFSFTPSDSGHSSQDALVKGELGIFTGSHPSVIELDVDNDKFVETDGSTTNEGIWLDLDFPVQELIDAGGVTRTYVVLHSFTIYDLDSLVNVNVHGNLTGLGRDGILTGVTGLVNNGAFTSQMLSKSNLGLGPNEINPTYALRRDTRTDAQMASGTPPLFSSTIPSTVADQLIAHFGRVPNNAIEQANMELYWILTGRGNFNAFGNLDDIYPGRWGDVTNLYTALALKQVADYPRPGRGDNQTQPVSSGNGARYGGNYASNGRAGYDDNENRYEGEAATILGKYRPFGHPMDFAGGGRHTTDRLNGFGGPRGTLANPPTGNALFPDILHADPLNPAAWLRYSGYSVTREVPAATGATTPFRSYPRYIFGANQIFDYATEGLMRSPVFDPLFEDPLEQIFDPSFALRPQDNGFGPQDVFALQMAEGDIGTSAESPNPRLAELAPFAFEASSRNREMITTYSNSYRYVPLLHPFGNDGRPGTRNVDDDGDGTIDEADEVLTGLGSYSDSDIASRWWEFSSDADGSDRNNDGFPDGDGNFEFPPSFAAGDPLSRPYGVNDPFRAQVRRSISVEAGENRGLLGQLPLSINHLIDVDRNPQTPREGTPEFQYYMQRSGLRFRSLTEHPSAHTNGDGIAAWDMVSADIPAYNPKVTSTDVLPVFPPQTIGQREFWARRDRQQLARDIYVLLYTMGGARKDGTNVVDYRRANNPDPALESTAITTLSPNDPTYFSTPQPFYNHQQLRRMAQFAVNLVDAMDTDNIVTKFEYDKNLGPNTSGSTAGWELDDNPYTSGDDADTTTSPAATENNLYLDDTNGRGVVYGVEAQQLALSEVLAIRSNRVTGASNNSPATPYTDDVDRDFLFVELQNMLPMELDLATDRSLSVTPEKGVWRLVRNRRSSDTSNLNDPNDPAIVIADHPENFIDGGGRFSLAVASDTSLPSSSFFIDTGDPVGGMFDGVHELIAPDVVGLSDNSTPSASGPLTDLDLRHTTHATRFALLNGEFLGTTLAPLTIATDAYNGNKTFDDRRPGNFTANGASIGFDLVLQRRMNPDLPSLSLADNPWVEVDRMKVIFTDLGLMDTDTPTDIYDPNWTGTPPTPPKLVNLTSQERTEPLDAVTVDSIAKTVTGHRRNTLKGATGPTLSDVMGVNSRKITTQTLHVGAGNDAIRFNVWQPHFDRDFASSVDLLSLPVFGPHAVTQQLQRSRLAPHQQVNGDGNSQVLISSAAGMFLMPDFPNIADAIVDQARDNRWYRVLQFLEVPSRVHRMLGNYLTQNRVPGKLNLNMIRHREVYAGLIDAPFLMDVPDTQDFTGYFTGPPGTDTGNQFEDGPFTFPAGNSAGPDLWHQFVNERDSLTLSHDPTGSAPGVSRLWIPGMPNSNPFRSLASGDEFVTPLQSTLFRTLRTDRFDSEVISGVRPEATNRNWLEVGDVVSHNSPAQITTSGERYQLISKIANNTTTVSNTFIVFATAGYFEAFEHTSGVNAGLVQVGGPLDVDGDSNIENDRKRAIFLIDRTDALNAYDAPTGSFDWERLIKARINVKE